MIATVLAQGGLDPTAVIGGKLNIFGSNAKLGQGSFWWPKRTKVMGLF